MIEETVFKMEKRMSNDEIAEQLRKIADKLESRQKIFLESGESSIELNTDRDAVFEIEVEREGEEESLELEIEWESGSESGSLEIS